ncbi:hypothetical protein [Flavihumibacter petaseus]|nr:hypothetical protein [Flavihumibacter petaseus]
MRYVKRKRLFRTRMVYSCLALILILTSCNPVKYSKTVPGQPDADSYSLGKSVDFGYSNSIDTSVIYIYYGELVFTTRSGKSEKVNTYDFLAFKSNGIVLFSRFSRVPVTNENVQTIGGQYCYYKVIDDELVLEMYDYSLKSFFLMYAKIYEDRIVFYKDRVRRFAGGKSKLNMRFNKSAIRYPTSLIWPL